jgi:hypothetical protein
MMPCNDLGWRAVFFNSADWRQAEHPEATLVPIIAWLWVKHGNEEGHGHPMVALGGEIVDAATIGNYLGVVEPRASADQIHDLLQAARGEISATWQKTA